MYNSHFTIVSIFKEETPRHENYIEKMEAKDFDTSLGKLYDQVELLHKHRIYFSLRGNSYSDERIIVLYGTVIYTVHAQFLIAACRTKTKSSL